MNTGLFTAAYYFYFSFTSFFGKAYLHSAEKRNCSC